MKALLFIPLLLASVVGLFAQVPADSENSPAKGDLDSQRAAVIAREFMQKVVSKDYDSAARMMTTPQGQDNNSAKAVKQRIESIKYVADRQAAMGDVVSFEVLEVGRFNQWPPYPEAVRISDVSVKVKYSGRDKELADKVSIIKQEDGSFKVWRYLD